MRFLPIFSALALAATLGCNDSPKSQDQVRRETAAATATIVSDTKAAAEGVRDGLHQELHRRPDARTDIVDINAASLSTLETLPGITPALSVRITKHRPYAATADLRKRHILTADEYAAISSRITTGS
jgi:DNA uptake protein ComE-like DNA-binding protein